jgi:hypothetical protein
MQREKSLNSSQLPPEKKYSDQNQHDAGQKQENGNAVNSMHVFHPLAAGRIGIRLLDIKVFGDLAKNSHMPI